MNIREILSSYWGHDEFRPMQEDIINSVLEGNDTLALLPTGGGKSVCFQVPAMTKEGLCLVVSPLIALMKDQVKQLTDRGIPALAIHSGLGFNDVKAQLKNAAYGNYKFLYVSPERIETSVFLEFLPAMHINLIAVDEAHCISQWGYDFRPAYQRIATLREHLPGVPLLALTASATKKVQEDICEKLLFQKGYKIFRQPFERPNLSYSVFSPPSKQHKLVEILQNVPGAAIVYCRNRKHTKEISEWLNMKNIKAAHYHAGLDHEERNRRQDDWINDKTRVIVATNAFGMGIDKPDVRAVIHYEIPDCIENYYQEAGRAGRDGKRSYAVLLYSEKEIQELQQLSEIRYPSGEEIKKLYIALMNHFQVAAGAGEGRSFDLDLSTFCNAFKLNMLTTGYGLKVLEQEQVISYNEFYFRPSTVVFTANRNDIESYERDFPGLEPLIKGLLRSYEGIIDFPSNVYERQLAKFTGIDLDALKEGLMQLHRAGIIAYDPQKETPQVRLLQNRMYADNYNVNTSDLKLRKEQFEHRVLSMIRYIKEGTACRSKWIAAYFDATTNKDCGICDNCLKQKRTKLSGGDFDLLSSKIIGLISERSYTPKELLQQLKDTPEEKFWGVVDFLQSEERIRITKEGKITL